MNSVSKVAALVFVAIASPLMATSITYDLNNVTSQDGATVGGMVTYDTVLATITGASITFTDAALGVTSPTLVDKVAAYGNVGGTVFQFDVCDDSCENMIDINTTTPLGAATVIIDPSTSPFGAFGQIRVGDQLPDLITGGTLVATTGTPEPAAGALLFLGVTGLVARNRYTRNRQAKL